MYVYIYMYVYRDTIHQSALSLTKFMETPNHLLIFQQSFYILQCMIK